MIKDDRTPFKTGIEYLQKTGLNLIMMTSFGKLSFQPGSAFEDIKKETLPRPYSIKNQTSEIFTLSTLFMDHYKIITKVDLQRLLRACAITLTNFHGPDEEDNPKAHKERLRQMLSKNTKNAPQYILLALHVIEEIMGQKKSLSDIDYQNAVNILNISFKLW